jgi:hypothetical protein
MVAKEAKADIILVYGARPPLFPSTIRALKKLAWTTSYHNDDLFGGNGSKLYNRYDLGSLNIYDSHHVYREENVTEFLARGAKRVNILQSYYLPWLDKPPVLSDKDLQEYGHDLVFIGHAEDDKRVSYIKSLLEAGFELRVYGIYGDKYWPRILSEEALRKLSPLRALFGLEYRKVLAASKISLCFLSRANRDLYTRRVFEIPAVGGFLLCERTAMMKNLYCEGVEADYFDSNEELIDKVTFYLSHPEIRARIAKAGYERCISSGYDIYSRIKQWLADLEEWRARDI